MTSFGCSTSVDVKPVEEESVQETLRLRLTATVSTDIALAGDILITQLKCAIKTTI